MDELREIGESIKASVPLVLAEWRELRQYEPWLSLPEAYNLDHLPEAVRTLVDAALVRPEDEEAHRAHVWAAATHGHHRLEQGFAEHMIFTEHHLLLRSLRRYVEDVHGDSPQRFAAIARLDAAATITTVASLRGYHRTALEQRGEWPEAIDRLIADEIRLFHRSGGGA